MLLLKLKLNDKLVLTLPDGRTITIQLCRVDPRQQKARLGITADRAIPIMREEIMDTQIEQSPMVTICLKSAHDVGAVTD